MSWRNYLSIWLLIKLTVITFVIASPPDDGRDSGRELNKSITTETTREIYSQVDTEERDTSYDVDENDDDEHQKKNDGESDGIDVDEYEGELRDIAESHEAMSRDDSNNSTDGINHSEISVLPGESSGGVKNFDSHEKSVEEGSDESMTSNEAISSELDQDMEVKELLKFKREDDQKCKRIPTVKKELSSQKEILGNDSHANATIEILNEFRDGNADGGAREIFGNEVLVHDDIRGESQVERRSLRRESGLRYENTHLDPVLLQSVENLDKNHQSDLESLEAYSPTTTQIKLRELETDEYTLAQSLMELLVKLASNPKHWERAHRLLKDIDDDLIRSRVLDSNKRHSEDANRGLNDSPNRTLLMREPVPTPKKPKKKKKKKKKTRFQMLATSAIPALPRATTTPMTVSTESPTQAHWRVVVDRLFRPSWSSPSNNHKSSNIAKVHYAVASKQLALPTTEQHNDNSEYIVDELSSATDSDHKYPLQRKFHFGKINTHEKGSSTNRHDSIQMSNYESDTSDRSNSRFNNYSPQDQNGNRNNHYDHYVGEKYRALDNEYSEDYRLPLDYPDNDFSRNRGYYNKPWKFSKYDLTQASNPYLDTGRTDWMAKYGPWKNFWQPMINNDNDNDDRSETYGKFGSWSPEKNMRNPSWHSIGGVPRGNVYSRDAIVHDENKNRSELIATWKSRQDQKDNTVMPKITMKTWNSLTSDPATWPFKLPDVKPWPKDKNGRTYNPNADLVMKLGLDKQGYDTKKDQNFQTNFKQTLTKLNNSLHENESKEWNKDRKIWPSRISSKIKSMGTWNIPVDQSTWKPYELDQQPPIKNSETSRWPDRTKEGTWRKKLPDWDVEFGKQSSHIPTWPSKWKQFSYHKVNSGSLTKSDIQPGGTQKMRNSFIAVSAISPPKYSDNYWRKNDIEDSSVHHSSRDVDDDDPTTQLLRSPKALQMNHGKSHITMSDHDEKNGTDPLENQLEDLRQNNHEEHNPATTTNPISSVAVNTSTITTEANMMDGRKKAITNTGKQITAMN